VPEPAPDLEPFGDAAWRARIDGDTDARALLDALRAVAGVTDAIVCEEHALVAFDPGARPSADAVRAALEGARSTPLQTSRGREHSVHVRYDGEDLEAVAHGVGLPKPDVLALHCAPTYRVAVVGFQPGFAYLRGLDPRLVVPRRAAPRTRVPALSVAIAGPYTGVYPFASPGGWSLVGTAIGFVPFDAQTGAALALGDRVRFVPEES
jgi:5-oxoprolinase (ATP-hydrolysing) subunit A